MKTTGSVVWFATLGAAIVAGLVGAFTVLSGGLGVYNATDVVFWSLPMAGYLFFVLTAAGLTFLSSLPTVFGLKQYYPFAKRAALLAGATLLTGLMCKGLDLGPVNTLLQLIYIFLSPNLSSPIWWMGTLYGIYLLFVLVKFYQVHKGHWHTSGGKAAAMGALLLALISYISLGAVFGIVEARPAFFGQFISVYFLLTALACGLAAIILATAVQDRLKDDRPGQAGGELFNQLGKVLAWVLAASLFVFLFRTLVGLSTTDEEFAGFQYMAGTWLYHFELWAGLVIPFVMMMVPNVRKSAAGKALASLLLLIGMFAGRMEVLLSAQIKPLGSMATGRPELVSYTPSIYEWGVILLALAIALLLYSLGNRFLNLEASPES